MFISSGYAEQFGNGNPHVIAGLSGVELIERIVERTFINPLQVEPEIPFEFDEGYWAGWALAYYQWRCGRSFETIFRRVPLEEIIEMYHPFHEMSDERFFEEMEKRFHERQTKVNLKKLRTSRGLSQSELAERSGVSLRVIQSYEQGYRNIGKAQSNVLFRLAKVLGCRAEDLVDDPLYAGESLIHR